MLKNRVSINYNINKENTILIENTQIDGDMIKGDSGGEKLHQCVDSHEQAGGACDDPGQEGADAPAAQGDGQAEVYQVGCRPEIQQHQVDQAQISAKVSLEEVQLKGHGREGGEQHPCVGGQPRVTGDKLETVKLWKRKGMPRD